MFFYPQLKQKRCDVFWCRRDDPVVGCNRWRRRRKGDEGRRLTRYSPILLDWIDRPLKNWVINIANWVAFMFTKVNYLQASTVTATFILIASKIERIPVQCSSKKINHSPWTCCWRKKITTKTSRFNFSWFFLPSFHQQQHWKLEAIW